MTLQKREVVVILPDIRSTHNTGAFFRTADGSGVQKIYLTGITAPPPHPHLVKVSLGAEEHIVWEYTEEILDVLEKLKNKGYQLVAVEQTEKSIAYTQGEYTEKVALIFGNEVEGLSPQILEVCDLIIDIPMRGVKESLNVSVAGGVILYHLLQ